MTRIIPASADNTAPRGAKALIVGPTGVGETSLLHALDPATVLFVDIETGDLAVQDVGVDTLRPRTWPECRDLAVYLDGVNPAVLTGAVYSEAHYNAVVGEFGDPPPQGAGRDSILIPQVCHRWPRLHRTQKGHFRHDGKKNRHQRCNG